MVVCVEKKVGETPLQALEAYRDMHPALKGVPMTYAGRLDPMASGQLLILVGDECKKKDSYTSLDKEYEFEVLLGIRSDTGDVLGLTTVCGAPAHDEYAARSLSSSLIGIHAVPYPLFSSKTVRGKQLFQHMHEGTEGDIEVPKTDMRIYELEYLGSRLFSAKELTDAVFNRIQSLRAPTTEYAGSDFRIELVSGGWRKAISRAEYPVLKWRARVGSGTYIRTLAERIATKLGTCGLAFSIHRTRIHLNDSVGR